MKKKILETNPMQTDMSFYSCGTLNMNPKLFKSWSHPVYVTLYGHWDFADVSKLKDFEMERLSWIIWVDPKCSHKGSY